MSILDQSQYFEVSYTFFDTHPPLSEQGFLEISDKDLMIGDYLLGMSMY
jgi:hypothetical protein